jgi:CheY-like chemotaxis protein
MSRGSVLIVEDEFIIAWHLQDIVTDLGYQVCAMVGAEAEAVEADRRHAPDLILMDIRLSGGGDGLKAAEAIRRQRPVPILFCTAHATDRGLAPRLLAIEHTSVLGKPVSRADLKNAIDALLAH